MYQPGIIRRLRLASRKDIEFGPDELVYYQSKGWRDLRFGGPDGPQRARSYRYFDGAGLGHIRSVKRY